MGQKHVRRSYIQIKRVSSYSARWAVMIKVSGRGRGSNLRRSALHKSEADSLTDWAMISRKSIRGEFGSSVWGRTVYFNCRKPISRFAPLFINPFPWPPLTGERKHSVWVLGTLIWFGRTWWLDGSGEVRSLPIGWVPIGSSAPLGRYR